MTHLNYGVKFLNRHGDCSSREGGPHDGYEMDKDE